MSEDMDKIIRTPKMAKGGITADEKVRMDEHVQMWIKRAFRTDPIEPEKITPAIEGLYEAAGLKKPRVVIVPSPLVMAFAYGASAAILHSRKNVNAATSAATSAATQAATQGATYAATQGATDAATRDATDAATYTATDAATQAATYAATQDATDTAIRAATQAATYAATRDATDAATDDATYAATRAAYAATLAATYAATDDATHTATYAATRAATHAATYAATDDATYAATRAAYAATDACFELAGNFGIECAKLWFRSYQGGNMWSSYDCYLTAFRDILGLDLPAHAKYRFWEQAAIHGGFRVMHEDFCIVSDFPERILVDERNRPHCENGPSHRWRDGWSLYHWHGVKVPAHWIEDRANLDPNEVIKCENVEQRAAGAEIVGWPKMLDVLKVKVINDSGNEDIGQLIELKLPGLNKPGRFLKARCPRNGIIVEGVPYKSDIDGLPINTALAAQAWRIGDAQSEYIHPENRT
jgi:hypothetical protein